MVPEEPAVFIETVMLRAHLDRLDPSQRPGFVERVASALPEPITIDYVRLNIEARRAA